MDFSVLIPVYDKENSLYLKDALESIWDFQTLKPKEILIVKDGPLTNDLNQIIENFILKAPVKLIEFSENRGLGYALNIGVQNCSYALIARMDSDDISRSDRFEKQVAFLYENPQFDLVGSNIVEFNANVNDIVSYRRVPEYPEKIKDFSKRRNPINHMSVVFRKEAVLNVGNYIECKGYEDYFLWSRMLMGGSLFYNIQENLINARIGNGMLARRQGFVYFIDELKFQKELYKMGFFSTMVYFTNFFLRALPHLFPLWALKYVYILLRK